MVNTSAGWSAHDDIQSGPAALAMSPFLRVELSSSTGSSLDGVNVAWFRASQRGPQRAAGSLVPLFSTSLAALQEPYIFVEPRLLVLWLAL